MTFLQIWHVKHKICQLATDDLLNGLRAAGHINLPFSTKTLIQTPRKN